MLSTHYSCPILIKLDFINRFPKNTQISYVMEIRSVGAEMFRADGQTERRDEANT